MNIGLITYHRYCNERQGCESRPTRYFRHHEHEPFHTSICVRAQTVEATVSSEGTR